MPENWPAADLDQRLRDGGASGVHPRAHPAAEHRHRHHSGSLPVACQLKTPAVKPESVTVTFVSSHALHGGAELHLASVIDRLGSDWVAGIVTLADGPLVGRLRGGGHSVEVVPTPARLGMLIAALKLRRVLRAQAPELVHADGVKAALVCALATVGTRIPILWFKVDYSRDGW